MKRILFLLIMALATFMVADAQTIPNGSYKSKYGVSYEFVGKDSLYVSDASEVDAYTYIICDSVLTMFDAWGQPNNVVIKGINEKQIVLYFPEEQRTYIFLKKNREKFGGVKKKL